MGPISSADQPENLKLGWAGCQGREAAVKVDGREIAFSLGTDPAGSCASQPWSVGRDGPWLPEVTQLSSICLTHPRFDLGTGRGDQIFVGR